MDQREVSDHIRVAWAEYQGRESRLRSIIEQLRGFGATWAQIGSALGTTPQAAQQRFSK